MITIFRNIKETSAPFFRDIDFVFDRIKNGKYKDLIGQIRAESDKTKRNELKKNLPAICFSGTFNRRADDAIIEHSGLICLDFDGYDTTEQMLSDKDSMRNDKYVMAVFISPSGNGLKTIVKIPTDPINHKKYFDALEKHFDSKYFDVTSKNISRVCYESYDADVYINKDSELWSTMIEEEPKPLERKKIISTVPVTNENKIVDRLMKWWTREYGLVEGERNANVFKLAAAFNDFGVSKSLAEYVIGQMESSSFPMSEIRTTINSAYKSVEKHGTKFYEDEEELHKIRTKINKGASSREIKKDLRNLNMDDDSIEEVIVSLEKDSSVSKFWTKSDKGTINVVHFLFKEFLELNGFYKFAPHGSDKYMFVRVSNNLINKASEEEVKDFTLKHLMNYDDLSIYNYFADKTRFFKEDFLSMLDTVNIYFVEDTKESSHIYFRNCALKVDKDNIEMIDYVDLGGYVWQDQVIDRDFEICDVTDCDFKKFISNISGSNAKRIQSLESTIGFLMSGYKDPGYCPSVILNDEVLTDIPEGGTGKGLFVQGISQMKKVSYIDGKTFSFDKQFAYQTITTDTQLISFDDVRKDFNFERLFSAITEGITIEKKNKDAISIPFKYAPKIIITTNYAIKGKGNSFVRRKWELEFTQHYTSELTPMDEFGRRLFDEWDKDEWCSFDNYMIHNLQFYLKEGLVKSAFKNLNLRRLVADTAVEFVEWLGLVKGSLPNPLIKKNKRMLKSDLHKDFVDDNPDFDSRGKNQISRITFYKWLSHYGSYEADVTVEEGRDRAGRWIMFKEKDYEEKGQEDLRF
ncbi:MAG TPA: hypothetical protein DCY51_03495 [Bacteroidetes bacterium]|nr:hypothetical protein [Bacteroidota bacterium]